MQYLQSTLKPWSEKDKYINIVYFFLLKSVVKSMTWTKKKEHDISKADRHPWFSLPWISSYEYSCMFQLNLLLHLCSNFCTVKCQGVNLKWQMMLSALLTWWDVYHISYGKYYLVIQNRFPRSSKPGNRYTF